MSENEFKIISTTFKKQAKNGQIQRKDFIKVMTKHGGMGEELANQLFDSFDTDNSGYVSAPIFSNFFEFFFGLCFLAPQPLPFAA